MKILKDSGVSHWILAQPVTCEQCNTQYQAQSREDFRPSYRGTTTVWITCPKYDHAQRVHKHWYQNQYLGADNKLDTKIGS